MELNHLREDAARIDWTEIFSTSAVDEKINMFNSRLTQLYDVHAPVRHVRIRHLPAPWLTAEIKTLQLLKCKAKAKYKSDSSPLNREKYRTSRNRCNKACRDAQRRHIHNSVLEEANSAKIWKFLKSLGVGKIKQNTASNSFDLNQLNKHFTSSVTIDLRLNLTHLINFLLLELFCHLLLLSLN
ncbi:unnamed protein product [Euphydryas editha]|uniref:Reverse transcriptase n=1 Tax=Euphydryas editha TaxID=104508 RepID=A0AAU9U8D7_EUPED|nr:unnamed protein product [Euphydryas editha]